MSILSTLTRGSQVEDDRRWYDLYYQFLACYYKEPVSFTMVTFSSCLAARIGSACTSDRPRCSNLGWIFLWGLSRRRYEWITFPFPPSNTMCDTEEIESWARLWPRRFFAWILLDLIPWRAFQRGRRLVHWEVLHIRPEYFSRGIENYWIHLVGEKCLSYELYDVGSQIVQFSVLISCTLDLDKAPI